MTILTAVQENIFREKQKNVSQGHILNHQRKISQIKKFYEFHNIFDNQEFIDIEDEKSEYDFQRIKFILNEFIEEKKYSNG